ncbi:MAG: hypothetical protein HOF38_03875 [Elusimicrobiaceae bacterium]|jgi:hypothetical protein|nr:hypothetical protein [Elusimicrobiaceae bacterium]MBT3955279.1 hypothetical protein [Elusimicrobiaceae bacterium]MBT4008305.1 hypothetical protein [Elusimicrobiaceae bacterium]MBT4403286.1 hypothetical protein [Elusimicrobiaceae bacterium]MBT4440434.1 hypothetical protein [Elusimicrobiaceae bacterium]
MQTINILIAFLFSLICPGAGQMFYGGFLKATIFSFIFIFGKIVLLPLLVRIFKIKTTQKILKLTYSFNIFYVCVIILSILDSVFFASKLQVGLSVQKIIFISIYCVAILTIYFNLKKRQALFTYLFSSNKELFSILNPKKR